MRKEMFEKNPILKLSFDFSLMAIKYCERLEVEKKYIISRQLFKSGTSIGANAMEVQNAESKVDFIHKMKIALKNLKNLNTGFGFVSTPTPIRIVWNTK